MLAVGLRVTELTVNAKKGENVDVVREAITLADRDGITTTEMLRDADAAMYRAKSRGRDCVEVFAPGTHDASMLNLRTTNELRRGIERGEIVPYYQPIITLETGDLVGFEVGGKKLWSRNLGPFAFQWTFSATPLLHKGQLIAQILQRDVAVRGRGKPTGNESYLLAIDPLTGKAKWRTPLLDFQHWSAVMTTGGGLVFTGKETGEFVAYDIDTGIGFLDHMLTAFARHGMFDLTVRAKGDLHIDFHHTTEDTGIAIGEAVAKALGDTITVRRFLRYQVGEAV